MPPSVTNFGFDLAAANMVFLWETSALLGAMGTPSTRWCTTLTLAWWTWRRSAIGPTKATWSRHLRQPRNTWEFHVCSTLRVKRRQLCFIFMPMWFKTVFLQNEPSLWRQCNASVGCTLLEVFCARSLQNIGGFCGLTSSNLLKQSRSRFMAVKKRKS